MGTPAQPITINFEGENHLFPADFTQQDIQKSLASYKNSRALEVGKSNGTLAPSAGEDYSLQSATPVNTSQVPVQSYHFPLDPQGSSDISRYSTPSILTNLGNALPAAGATIASEIPVVGPALGAGAGSMIKRGLQTVFPKLFGSIPSDTSDIADTALDTLGAGVLPQVAGKVLGGAASMLTPEGRAAALATTFKNTGPVQEAVGRDVTEGVNAFTGNSFSELTSPRLEATRNLFKEGFSPSTGRIDADAILDEMKLNPDKYKAIPTEIKSNITDFVNQAKTMQSDKAVNSGSLISMVKGSPLLAIPGAGAGMAAGGLLGHGYVGATVGAGAGIILGEKAISHLMSNPETAKLVIQAMKTPAGSEVSNVLSKVITNSLRGVEVLITNSETGKQEKAIVGPDGKPQLPLQTR